MSKVAYTLPEAAAMCSLNETTITEAVRDGGLLAREAGVQVIVTRADLKLWVKGLPLLSE